MRSLAALVAAFALTRVTYSLSSTLTQMTNFTSTETDVSMWVYVPEIITSTEEQAIVVAIHSCERSAEYYYENTGYAALADQEGYMVIFPNKSTPSGCWDTQTSASLTRDGGGDSHNIVQMVTYAGQYLNGNTSNVAVTGSSSGAIMVQVLAALYPDYFQAASVYSGEWLDAVSTADSGYDGSRPKMMIYHGTVDDTYPYTNLAEELEGWSSIMDVTYTDNTSFPVAGYTELVYGDGLKLVGVSAEGAGHTVPVNAVEDMVWFCISPKCGTDGLAISSTTSQIVLSTTTASESASTSSAAATTTTDSSAAATPTGTGESSEATSAAAGDASGSSKLSTSTIAAIGAGGAVVLGLLTIGAICLRKRHHKTVSNPKTEHKMAALDPDGHEYHSGYGMVPGGQGARQVASRQEKFGGIVEPQSPHSPNSPHFQGGLEPFVTPAYPREYHRDSNASSLLPPHSVYSMEQRGSTYSSASSTNLLGPRTLGDDQRFSVASSAMILPPNRTYSPGNEDDRPSSSHDNLLPTLPSMEPTIPNLTSRPSLPNIQLEPTIPNLASRNEEQDISDISFRRHL